MRASVFAFAVVSIVHLLSVLFMSRGALRDGTQMALMLALAAVLLAATKTPRSRLVRLTLVGLLFSWVGDTLPRFMQGDAAFLAMVGGFLVAQVVYAIAFWPYRQRSILGRRSPLVMLYLLAVGGMVWLCFEGAGPLAPAVVAYAIVIACMAILATGLGAWAAIGGLMFMLSDSLIAIRAFASVTVPLHSFLVMLTYIIAEAMLVIGVLKTELAKEVP